MENLYSDADKRLARALIAVDVGEVAAALADGATAQKAPFQGISWSLIPLYFKARQGGLDADFSDAKQIMRYLIQEGSPVKGLAHFAGAGYPFSTGDIGHLLDSWLWRDADELTVLASRYLDNDEIMMQLIGTGQIASATPVGEGTLFTEICLAGLHRSAFEFAGLGADINGVVTLEGEAMPLIEAVAQKGHAAVLNALLRSGAFYDSDQVMEKARRHSPECEATVTKCLSAFEIGVDLSDEDVLLQMKTAQPRT